MIKKIVKVVLITLLVLTGVAFAAPLLFKDKIVAKVKAAINKNVMAEVDFADIDISLFRHFPKLSVAIEQIHVKGVDQFSKDTLISASSIDLSLNLMSVISGGEMQIYSVNLDEPRIHAIVDKHGKANWDIMKPDTSTAVANEDTEPFKMQLKRYGIKNGYVSYVDDTSNMSMQIINLNHSGSGDFTSNLFTLKTSTSADAVNFTYENIPYLLNTQASIDADIEIDNTKDKYTFSTEDVRLNDLRLSTKGFFQFLDDSTYNMDIAFSTPSNDFKSILSLVPAVYKNDFKNIKTSGSALLNGFVKGKYNSTMMPAYRFNLEVKDGFFQYPDLPKPVQHINFIVKVDNPDGVTDNTVIDIPTAHIEMDNEPFDFKLLVKKPITDQFIDAVAKGKLDLSRLATYIKLDPGTKLSGKVEADIQAIGNLSVITQKKAGPFKASGFINATNLAYASKDFPQPISNTSFNMDIQSPDGIPDHTIVTIPQAHVEVGKEAVDFKLLVKTPVSDPYFNGEARGKLNLANVEQFVTFEPGTKLSGNMQADLKFNGNKSAIDKKEYEKINTAGTVKLSGVHYVSKDYPEGVSVNNLNASFTPQRVLLSDMNGNFKHSAFQANGSINNFLAYALKDEMLEGTLNLSADKVNVNEWMGTTDTTASTATETSEPFLVPSNIAFSIYSKVGKVLYDKLEINNLSGKLDVRNETVKMEEVSGQALGGTMTINGSYSTRVNKKNPDITMSYDVKDVNIQQSFYAFNTLQKLMPIGQFLGGKISSQFTMNGKLGDSMMPDLSSLSGKGLFLVIEGMLKDFKPLTQLSQALNVKELGDLTMKNIKSNFEFANGKVLVKPFTVKSNDIDMEIGGMHGLDQSLDYIINIRMPRSKLGEKGNQLVNGLMSQAAAKGVPMQVSDVVSFNVNMGGTIKNPSFKINLKESGATLAAEMKKQATDFAKAKLDTVKSVVKDTLMAVKKDLVKLAQEELAKKLKQQKDSTVSGQPSQDTRKRLEEAGKGVINGFFKKKKAVADTTNSK